MKKIVNFGNCQTFQLQRILAQVLGKADYSITKFSNNLRTGDKLPDELILTAISDCDILLYQPLSRHHGALSDDNVRKTIKPDCLRISLPYIFNSGIYAICQAPAMRSPHSYGVIFGEEAIIERVKAGQGKAEILEAYRKGAIDFKLVERFQASFDEMRRREANIDIKLTDFIAQHYRDIKLFTSHNHPSNALFFEMVRQIAELAGLPIDPADFERVTVPDLPETNCPISPYDIATHGYKFAHHEDWYAKGSALIELIVDTYFAEQAAAPAVEQVA